MEYRHIIVTVLGVLINAAISHSSQVITTQIGQTVTIHCQLSNLDSDLRYIYWKKNETTVENETTVYARTINGESAKGKHFVIGGTTSSLVIPDIVESDTGSYYCRVVRQSLRTEDSEIIKLYATAFYVSDCNGDSQQVVDGCSCYVNGANITSLSCSARGFPNHPVITWAWWEEESEYTIRSSSVDLTRFSENVTLVCKAQDRDLEDISANTSVCVYYRPNDEERGGDMQKKIWPTEETPPVLAITLSLVLIALIICIIFISLWVYRRKKGIPFCGTHPIFRRTSTPKSIGASDELKFNTIQLRMKSVEEDLESLDLPTKDFNEDMIFEDAPELSFPLAGQVLLDDLRSSSSEDFKKSLKGVIDRLLNKRARPYKEFQMPIDASYGSMPLNASVLGLQSLLKESMVADGSADRDVFFVGLVLQKLDQILDETDRDECEILITKPDFQEVTDASQIPAYQGSRVINRSIALQSSMKSSMNRSRIACSLESSVIREELKPLTPSERTAARNAISQIILDALGKRQRANHNLLNRSTDMLQHTEDGFHGAEDLVDENSRLVALWASKVSKLDDEVNSSITEYLFPLKPRKPEENKTAEPLIEPVKGPIDMIEETPDEPGKGSMKQTTEEHVKEPMEETMNESKEGPMGATMKEQGKDAVGETLEEPVKEPMENSMNMTEESCHQHDQGQHECADCPATPSSDDSFEK